ncbi:hypothetical protein LZ31DRAFT_218624 [Colletotrichum somersetense]|nr:hypothetical protein LZ31DRAFT_218624 [Colletotrichum somersetense]
MSPPFLYQYCRADRRLCSNVNKRHFTAVGLKNLGVRRHQSDAAVSQTSKTPTYVAFTQRAAFRKLPHARAEETLATHSKAAELSNIPPAPNASGDPRPLSIPAVCNTRCRPPRGDVRFGRRAGVAILRYQVMPPARWAMAIFILFFYFWFFCGGRSRKRRTRLSRGWASEGIAAEKTIEVDGDLSNWPTFVSLETVQPAARSGFVCAINTGRAALSFF